MSGLQKLEQRAKCIELRGEYVELIPSLVAVACFLPGRAKDLSVTPRTITGRPFATDSGIDPRTDHTAFVVEYVALGLVLP